MNNLFVLIICKHAKLFQHYCSLMLLKIINNQWVFYNSYIFY